MAILKAFSLKAWRSTRFAVILLFSTCNINAGAYQLFEQDASQIGVAHAGDAALNDTAAIEFYNPAAMAFCHRPLLSAGLAYLPLRVYFSGSVGDNPAVDTSARSITNNFIPNFHIVYPLNDRVVFGLGVNAPFGAATEYSSDQPIATAATSTKLLTLNLNPSMAVRLHQNWSFAVGLDILYADAQYNNAFTDLQLIPAPTLTNHVTGWGVGWNAGIFYQKNAALRLGLAYRSVVPVTAKGVSTYHETTLHEIYRNDQLKAQLVFPASVLFSAIQSVNENTDILFSLGTTFWHRLHNMRLNGVLLFPHTPAVIILHENYRNTWNAAIGLRYKYSDKWHFKWGLQWDHTPTVNGMRDVRLPDSNHVLLGLGAHWQWRPRWSIDIGYAHVFADRASIDNRDSQTVVVNGHPLNNIVKKMFTVGDATVRADVIGVQIQHTL